MTGLSPPPRRVGERRTGHQGAGPGRAELAGERVHAEEGQREREHERDVVPQERGLEPATDEAERREPEQGVGEGEAVLLRIERI
jgi:hypothetical protein